MHYIFFVKISLLNAGFNMKMAQTSEKGYTLSLISLPMLMHKTLFCSCVNRAWLHSENFANA